MGNDQTGRISFSCTECGSDMFVLPHNPPKDDDIIRCAGCNREIGRYDDIQRAAIDAGKAEIDKITMNIFGKKPTWRKG
jgi:DNA-directed RNA polymerase subunit RPC12/RpoP